MLIDTHVHTKNISLCSLLSWNEAADIYKSGGYDGVMLTNHFSLFLPFRKGFTDIEWIDAYMAEYQNMYQYGKSIGLKVFFGVEVSIYKNNKYRPGDKIVSESDFGADTHFLLFGVTESFLRKHPRMYLYTIEEMSGLCRSEGILFIQAHPLRGEGVLLSPEVIDGAEINCAPLYYNEKESVLEFAKEHDKIVTVGSDAHSVEGALRGGIYIPDDIGDCTELADYLKEVRIPKYYLR